MSRTASGREVLDRAKACLKEARTIEELRQAQAALLPLEFGLPLPQVAQALGVSSGRVCRLRNHLEIALREMELDTQRVRSIAAWSWILFDFYFKTTTIVPAVILRVAKRSRRIQTPHGFRDYARNDGPSQ